MRSISWLLVLGACMDAPAAPPRPEPTKLDDYVRPREREKPSRGDRYDIDIYVDAVPVATIGEHQFAERPRIDLQLPPDATIDRWKAIRIETDGEPVLIDWPGFSGHTRWPGIPGQSRRPLATQPDTVPMVFSGTGRAGTFALVDKRNATRRTVENAREIRIELATDGRSDREKAFARACTPMKRGEEKPPPGKGRWVGTAFQFNINEYWTIDMTIDLSNSNVGDKVGTVVYHGHKCRGNLFRLPDVDGRRRVVERFWHNEGGICVEACILELACDGTSLAYRGLYPDGTYVAHAKLVRPK